MTTVTIRGFKLHVIVVVAVLLVAIGLGAQKYVHSQRVVLPLEREFATIEGVENVSLQANGDVTDVILTLAYVSNFPRLYERIESLGEERLGDGLGRIIIEDARNEQLLAHYYTLHFALHEAAVTGMFTDMDETLARLAATLPMDEYKVFVGDTHIYLQMSSAEGHLYERIPRRHTSVTGAQYEGGVER